MLDDVKDQDLTEDAQPQAEETAAQDSQPDEQSTEAPADNSEGDQNPAEETQNHKGDLTVALREERRQRRELQKKIADLESKNARSQVDPDDYDSWAANPLSQDLMLKVAKQELTDFAREELEKYPTLNPTIKKAILKNVRGFVNEKTTDVEVAKVDIVEFIEDVIDEQGTPETQLPKKGFTVAKTNTTTSDSNPANSAEVQKILDKDVMDWSDEEEKIVADYQKRNAK